MDRTAFLSVRVPESVRNRVKSVAAERGIKVQDLVGSLIEQFLEEAERKPPELSDTLRCLREMEAPLKAQGVGAMWIFGSVARGDARPDSDVDLTVEFSPGREPSLFDLGRIQTMIEDVLKRSVDIGTRSAMTPRVAAAAERDLVQVF